MQFAALLHNMRGNSCYVLYVHICMYVSDNWTMTTEYYREGKREDFSPLVYYIHCPTFLF